MRTGTATRCTAALLGLVVVLVVAVPPTPPAAAAADPPGIRGVVRGSADDPIPGALVAALRPSDFSPVATAVADADGSYELDGLVAGGHFVYAVDPTGDHVAGFHGPPTVVEVGSGWAAADPVLAAARGSVSGQVTGEGQPLGGALVLALSGVDGRVVQGARTDADGRYRLEGLAPRDHLLVHLDATGEHLPEYHDDSDIAGADPITVQAGEVQVVDADLSGTDAPEQEATVQGTITDEATGAPVAGWVVVLDAATFQVEGAGVAGADGTWSVPVDAGGHRLLVLDPTATHESEWHPNLPYDALASAAVVEVSAGGTRTVDAALAPTTGSVHGQITEDGSGDPVPGAWALLIGSDGPRAVVADGDGAYRLDGVPAGEHRATFLGPDGLQLQEYWDGAGGFGDADPFTLAGGEVRGLDVALAGRPCGASVPAPPTRCVVAHPAPAPGPAWATWTIPAGAHSANAPVHGAEAPQTLHGWFVNPGRLARRYQFVFDGSARYVLTNPTQPEDQLDWNKLPGLSDCGDLDLAQNGWMFAWRWRTDLAPRVLEVNAYANNDGQHLWLDEPLLTLTSEQLDARVPLWFDLRVSSDRTRYEFTVRGPGTRLATGSLPRACTTTSPAWQWPGGFYFGGTSTAPSPITGLVRELPA